MRLISVDLEFNQPSQKIIQIGAVCFQPNNGAIVEIFNRFVDPKEPIAPFITELTSISDKTLEGAVSIQIAATAFNDFKQRLQANAIGVVWGAGLSNDIRKIYEESGIESSFKTRILDVKGVFQMLANASGTKFRQKVGLAKACELAGLNWDSLYGPPHNALADAYNTMKLYMFLSKCLKGGVEIKLG